MYIIPEIEKEGLTDRTLELLKQHWDVPRIGCYGLTEAERAQVQDHAPTSDYIVEPVGDVTDFIAAPYRFGIIRAYADTAKELNVLWAYCSGVEMQANSFLIIGSIPIPKSLQSRISNVYTFEDALSNLKYDLLNAHSRHRKNKEFSTQLANVLCILRSIRSCPGITSKQLSENLEISYRSVIRHIETLRIAGECIEYDPKTRGWKLGLDGRSVLLDI